MESIEWKAERIRSGASASNKVKIVAWLWGARRIDLLHQVFQNKKRG